MKRLLTTVVRIGAFFSARRRGTCIWLGFLIFLLLALFPPWMQSSQPSREYFRSHSQQLWHAPLFRPPTTEVRWWAPEVDYSANVHRNCGWRGFRVRALLHLGPPAKPLAEHTGIVSRMTVLAANPVSIAIDLLGLAMTSSIHATWASDIVRPPIQVQIQLVAH